MDKTFDNVIIIMQKDDETCKILTDDNGHVCHFESKEEAIEYLKSDSGSNTFSKLYNEGYTNIFAIVNPVLESFKTFGG